MLFRIFKQAERETMIDLFSLENQFCNFFRIMRRQCVSVEPTLSHVCHHVFDALSCLSSPITSATGAITSAQPLQVSTACS